MNLYVAVVFYTATVYLCGYFVGRWVQRRATIKDVQELMEDFRALHAVSDRLANILSLVDSDEITRANEALLAEEGEAMLRELDRERGEA